MGLWCIILLLVVVADECVGLQIGVTKNSWNYRSKGLKLNVNSHTQTQPHQSLWTAKLSDQQYILAPSILSANFAMLGQEVTNVLTAGADVIHFDVMDSHYVPTLTMGPMVCRALRQHGVSADIDVHLMVSPVDELIRQFAAAGASYITFHPDATNNIRYSLQLIRSLGCKSGLACNPDVSLEILVPYFEDMDILLMMAVTPGAAGQTLLPHTLSKLQKTAQVLDSVGYRNTIRLAVDGGVHTLNIRQLAMAGANMFVAGSAIFKEPRTMEGYRDTIQQMRHELSCFNSS